MADRLLSWFFLGVVAGLMPLLTELALRVVLARPHSLPDLVGGGELLLIAVVLGSSAVGALVGSDASSARTIAWGVGFPCLLLLGVMYGGLRASPGNVSRESVATLSGIAFLVTAVIGACSVSMAREAE